MLSLFREYLYHKVQTKILIQMEVVIVHVALINNANLIIIVIKKV